MDPLGDPLTTCPIQMGQEVSLEPYPKRRFGFIDELDSHSGNGLVWTWTWTRSDGPEPLLTLESTTMNSPDYWRSSASLQCHHSKGVAVNIHFYCTSRLSISHTICIVQSQMSILTIVPVAFLNLPIGVLLILNLGAPFTKTQWNMPGPQHFELLAFSWSNHW